MQKSCLHARVQTKQNDVTRRQSETRSRLLL